MACQSNPKTYSIVFRCPLEDGAILKTLADASGETISAYVAKIIHGHVGERDLTDAEKVWLDEHLQANLARRARADELTAKGYYKRKHRGRPRKPGPRKGWKKKEAKVEDGESK